MNQLNRRVVFEIFEKIVNAIRKTGQKLYISMKRESQIQQKKSSFKNTFSALMKTSTFCHSSCASLELPTRTFRAIKTLADQSLIDHVIKSNFNTNKCVCEAEVCHYRYRYVFLLCACILFLFLLLLLLLLFISFSFLYRSSFAFVSFILFHIAQHNETPNKE